MKWRECDVFERLRHVWPSPAHVRLPQVRNGTGYVRSRTRTVDGLIVSVYPSRGLWLAGIEIKVSRADWKKELSDPEKAESVARFCDFWYVAAPTGVVPVEEVPATWGLVECQSNSAAIAKKAPQNVDRLPPDILFLASVLRSVESATVPVMECHQRVMAARDGVKNDLDQAIKDRNELNHLRQVVSRFEQLSGLSIDQWSYGDVARAVKVIKEAGSPDAALRNLKVQAQAVIGVAQRLESVLANSEECE